MAAAAAARRGGACGAAAARSHARRRPRRRRAAAAAAGGGEAGAGRGGEGSSGIAAGAAPAPRARVVAPPAEPALPAASRALLWYTLTDLRVDDHAGLRAAAERAETLACVATLSSAALARRTVREVRVLRCALAALAEELERLGGVLHVSVVDDEAAELARLAELCNADALVYHADPARAESDAAIAAAVADATDGRCTPRPWAGGLGAPAAAACAALDEARGESTDYSAFVRGGGKVAGEGAAAAPQDPPRVLPPEPEAIAAISGSVPAGGSARDRVPSASELLGAARSARGGLPLPDGYDIFGSADEGGPRRTLALLDEYANLDARVFQQRWLPVGGDVGHRARSSPAPEHAAMARCVAADGGGPTAAGALNAGEAFSRTFSELLALGCVSARRARHLMAARIEAAEKAVGPIARLGHSVAALASEEAGVQSAMAARAAAAVRAIDSAEWHRRLAWTDLQERSVHDEAAARRGAKPIEVRYWRWHGILLRYAVTAPSAVTSASAPPLVCVHGFGASADQWDDLTAEMAASGRRVYAVDLPGFGHAQKPAISYTQYLWEQSVVDFGRQVVGVPHYLAGNSIGGYTAASAAAAMGPSEVLGLVLLNSAGRLLPREEEAAERERRGGFTLRATMAAKGASVLPALKPPPAWVLELGGKALFMYLQPNIKSICVKVYPNNPDAVDDLLCGGILRDSNDPGAVNVLTSGAKLPMPISKNELLETYGGRVLVCQGLNDPLGGNQARPRFQLYGRVYDRADAAPHCPPGDITLVGLEAGHCPHDEAPAEVAEAIMAFMQDDGMAGGRDDSAVNVMQA